MIRLYISFQYVTQNPEYSQLDTGSCSNVKAQIVIEENCNVLSVIGPNLLDFGYNARFDNYTYVTLNLNYSIGQTYVNITVYCDNNIFPYLNYSNIFQCIKFPVEQFNLTQSQMIATFPNAGYSRFEVVLLSPFKYDVRLDSIYCITECLICELRSSRLHKDQIYFVISLEPFLIQPCSLQNFTISLYVLNNVYKYNFTNQFFIDDSLMSIYSNSSYPNTVTPQYYSYTSNRAVWFSAAVQNLSPFYTTFSNTLIANSELFPISGNRKNVTLLNAKIPEPYNQFYVGFKGYTQNISITSPIYSYTFAPTFFPGYNLIAWYTSSAGIPNTILGRFSFSRAIANQLSTYVKWSDDGFIFSRYDYPFGYYNGNITLATHDSMHPMGLYAQSNLSVTYIAPVTINITDSYFKSNIRVNNVTLTPFGTYQYILRINVTEPMYGIFQIRSGSCVLLEKDLVVGTIYNGCYEKVCSIDYQNGQSSLDFEIRIYSKSMDTFYYRTNQFIPYTSTFLPRFNYQFNIPLGDFKYVFFLSSVQNVTNQTVKNYFIFNVTNPIKTFKPILEILNSDFNGNRKQFVGEWNETIGLYIIPITIPMNYFEGLVPYRLLTLPQSINNAEFFSIFGNQSQLYLESKNCDMIGPLVETVSVVDSGSALTWTLVIHDLVNGFKDGYINVTSIYNPFPYRYELLPNRISGDEYIGTYRIKHVNPPYIDDVIRISMWAIDKGGNQVTSYVFDRNIPEFRDPSSSPILYGDPFMKIYGTAMESQLSAPYTSSNIPSAAPPILDSFAILNTTIDVGLPNQKLAFNFTISSNTILHSENPPVIYISSLYNQIAQCSSTQLGISQDITSYQCETYLPYGFGSSDRFYVSIYGIRDIYGKLNGYSPLNLANFDPGRSGTFNRTYTRDTPNLERYDPISSKGGALTVYGNQFGNDIQSLIVLITLPTKSHMIVGNDILVLSNSYIIFNTIPFTTKNYSISISRNNLSSNILVIIPYDPVDIIVPNIPTTQPTNTPTDTPTTSPSDTPSNTPTNTPKICPGSPKPCSGNGNCVNSQCICNQNWYGPDCASELVPAPPPVINPNQPETNTTIISPTQNTIISTLSIVSLREIDNNDQVVTDYNLTNHNWTFKNTTNTMNNYIEYQYSTSINTTNLSVKIQYFSKETNVSFAGEYYLMTASSIKYSMMISNYDFKSKLNGLQVVLSATLVGGQGDCTSRSFGSNKTSNGIEDIQWVKLKVGYESLYGRFLQNAVIDNNRVIQITNILLDDQYQAITSSSSATQTYIGINIPQFEQNVYIDPDFSILVDNSPASQDSNSICNSSSKKLSKYQIVGIVIGCTAFVVAITLGLVYVRWKNMKRKQYLDNLNMKMEKFNSETK